MKEAAHALCIVTRPRLMFLCAIPFVNLRMLAAGGINGSPQWLGASVGNVTHLPSAGAVAPPHNRADSTKAVVVKAGMVAAEAV